MSDTFNPSVIKGDTITFTLGVAGPTGGIYDLSGTTLSMQVRKSYHPSGLLASYQLYVPSGAPLVPVDGVTGGLAVNLLTGMIYVTIGSA